MKILKIVDRTIRKLLLSLSPGWKIVGKVDTPLGTGYVMKIKTKSKRPSDKF